MDQTPSINNLAIDSDLFKKLLSNFKNKTRKKSLSKETLNNIEKKRKIKRILSNKSRKINQKKNRLNKFQK